MYNVLLNMVYSMHLYFTDTLGYQGHLYSSRQIHAMNKGLMTEIDAAMYLVIFDT